MGVDVQGAYLAIHLGPSSTIDDYIQECGRVGRSNEIMSHAVILKSIQGVQEVRILKRQ